MAARVDSSEIFTSLSSKIGQLLFARTEGDRNVISKTLDDLNLLNYRYPIVSSPTKAVLLINQLCSFIPTDDTELVQKCSYLLTNLINRQNVVVEGRTLTISVQWCLQSLKLTDKSVVADILLSLDALLRSNGQNSNHLFQNVSEEIKILIERHKKENGFNIILLALKCLEAGTVVPENVKQKNEDLNLSLEIATSIFVYYLCNKDDKVDELLYTKILIVCLNGLQNIVVQNPDYLRTELGLILGIIKTYMVYGIKGIDFIRPQKLNPTTMSIPESPSSGSWEKKGGKLTKQRKHKPFVANNNCKVTDDTGYIRTTGYIPATTTIEYNSDSGTSAGGLTRRLNTSDSDFSDSESGKTAKINITQGRVRQAALNVFQNVVKHTEKSAMFSYWMLFVPETKHSGKHNLITSFLKDPSARARNAALNVLLQLINNSKMYLSQAETSEKSTSFTPFSVILGLTLKELHYSLALALNEISVPVLTQVLKCFAALIQATPYHRLSSGIITKIIRNVKPFIYHKDSSVQVTALVVIGCILASEPVVPETTQALIRLQKIPTERKEESKNLEEDFDYVQFSSDEEENSIESEESGKISWVIEKCLLNLGVSFEKTQKSQEAVTAPIKMESLQVLSAMSRNYFDSLMAPHLSFITKALEISLQDKYTDIKLHAGRTVDFIGQAMSRCLTEDTHIVKMDQCVYFWFNLLNGPLINVLQNETYPILRSVGCDCVGSIGPQIFEQLPREKQLLCITVLFTNARDQEKNVKGAAIRALAICVLYPTLREDVGFVVDTAESIHTALNDQNMMVRIKASWSLGNLSDALVLNNSISNLEEFPKKLTVKLIEASIKGASDTDKIKMNAVRALGNLLLLIDNDKSAEILSNNVVEKAFSALVKSSTTGLNMKVRWNACYAIGKALKNNFLYNISTDPVVSSPNWQVSVFNSLMDLVINFKNFKVRINAALALMSPSNRECYGQFYIQVWTAMFKALENSQNMADFNEYKHRDNLIEQICLTLAHLTSTISKEDLPQLIDIITLNYDNFKLNMHKVLERLVPEKSGTFNDATAKLVYLECQNSQNPDHKGIIDKLKTIFIYEF